MITAIDTNILLDVLIPGAPFGEVSQRALEASLQAGSLVISDLVYAELAAHFLSQAELNHFLTETAIVVVPPSRAALVQAGEAWARYRHRRGNDPICPRCGLTQQLNCDSCRAPFRWRQHVITDFVIGAHAVTHADRLLTRDRGYYRAYFEGLHVMDPAQGRPSTNSSTDV